MLTKLNKLKQTWLNLKKATQLAHLEKKQRKITKEYILNANLAKTKNRRITKKFTLVKEDK
jgi:plasmid maintenance system antidote protein VapI